MVGIDVALAHSFVVRVGTSLVEFLGIFLVSWNELSVDFYRKE